MVWKFVVGLQVLSDVTKFTELVSAVKLGYGDFPILRSTAAE